MSDPSKESGLNIQAVEALEPDKPAPPSYMTRASGVAREIGVGGAVTLILMMDHGFRIYSEQEVILLGAVEADESKRDLIASFVENWIAHSAKPSTLWITTTHDDEGFGYGAHVHREALNEFGKLTGELHSLAEDLIAQGLCVSTDDVEPDA